MDHYNPQKLQLIAATCEGFWPTTDFFSIIKKPFAYTGFSFFVIHKGKKIMAIWLSLAICFLIVCFYNFNRNVQFLIIWLQPTTAPCSPTARMEEREKDFVVENCRYFRTRIPEWRRNSKWQQGMFLKGQQCTHQSWSIICFLAHKQGPVLCHAITRLS